MRGTSNDKLSGVEEGGSAPNAPAASRRLKTWLLLVGVVVCAWIAGSSVPRLLWPADEALPTKDNHSLALERAVPKPVRLPPLPTTPDEVTTELSEVATRLVERFPNSADAAAVMAQLEDFNGHTVEAAEWWERSLRLDPGSINAQKAYVNMARIATEKGDYEEAAALSRQALAVGPASSRAHNLLAGALIELGKAEEAIAVLEESLKTDPEPLEGRCLLGKAYLQLDDYEKAKQHYRAALEIHPAYPTACYGLATVLLRLGQKDQSKEYFERFKSLEATGEPAGFGQLRVEGLAVMRRGLAQVCVLAGRVYEEHGASQQAEAHWLRAAALDPANRACRRALFSLYRRQGRTQDALTIMHQLNQSGPPIRMR